MGEIGLVRPSREGDQFHYHWAARQCLRLLDLHGVLVAVTVEGPSAKEVPQVPISEGEEIIDVGLYYGAEDLSAATAVHYVQLKHSTLRTDIPWTASGLERTINGFARRFSQLMDRASAGETSADYRFQFVTNRPVSPTVKTALNELASGQGPTDPKLADQLRGYAGLPCAATDAFFRTFSIESTVDGLWVQRNLLAEDARAYLPDYNYEAPVLLKELVTQKALAGAASDPSIRRHDVLRALKADTPDLFPAANEVKGAAEAFARAQETSILDQVICAQAPVIIHADGGVGKSILAARLAAIMPSGSVSVHYDCFGDGLYRSAHNFRHRPRDGFVEIANELSVRGLCHPLIPTAHADVRAYLRAFTHRLAQATAILTANDPSAVLCIIIDAADNAEIAAKADGEASSFARHLLHTPMPKAVRLVFSCRSHRRDLLQLPPEAIQIELEPFNWAETARHLRAKYPEATDLEVAEFQHVSSANPRVQALAMDQGKPLRDMLQGLGPNPTTISAAIGELLSDAIRQLKARSDGVGVDQIDEICRGLAILRPLVPIPILSALTGVDGGAIRTFAYDLGRPLSVRGESLHFLDEPAETWFRETFVPDLGTLSRFLDRLRPLASNSAYAAGILPLLLLESGRTSELVELALSDEALPTASPLERRDIEIRRLTFALKATLREHSYAAAAKLALRAAGEIAGEDRQEGLLQSNIHLAGSLLEPDRLLDLVSRRTFGAAWMGSHHAYDAAILSVRDDLKPEATSRLRMAMEWLWSWARRIRSQSQDDQERETVSDEDRAAIALAQLRLRGATASAGFLRSWTSRQISFSSGRILARQLADLGDFQALEDLARAAGNNVWLLLALAREARAAGCSLPQPCLLRLMRLLCFRRLKLEESGSWDGRFDVLGAVTDCVELAIAGLPPDPGRWAELLRRYMPKTPPEDLTARYGTDVRALLRPYVLEAALLNQPLSLVDVAPPSIRKEFNADIRSSGRSAEGEIFRLEVGGLLPWLNLAASIACGRRPDNLANEISTALGASDAAMRQSYRETLRLRQSIAMAWIDLLAEMGATDDVSVTAFKTWMEGAGQSFWPSTLFSICRRAARTPGLEDLAIDFATLAGSLLENSREQAESRTESYMQLASAVFAASPAEARAYFDQGLSIADRVGEENIDRWTALLRLAHAAAEPDLPRPATAYRLSRAAELVYEYVARDKYFDWDGSVSALARLSPISSLAIASRWRDRRFGSSGRILSLAICQLVEDGNLPPRAKIALAGIDAEWSRLKDIQAFLAASESPSVRRLGAEIAFRYIRLQSCQADELKVLENIAVSEGARFPDLERMLAFKTNIRPAKAVTPPDRAGATPATEPQNPNWDELFDGVDVTDSQALLAAYNRYRRGDRPYKFEDFYAQSALRTPAGSESAWLNAIGEWPDLSFFDLESILKAARPNWLKRLAFRQAVRGLVLNFFRREPQRGCFSPYSYYRPLESVITQEIVSRNDAVEACLTGYAEQAETLDAGRLFHLLEPLAERLSHDEADEALNFGLDLLEPTLKPDDGDGVWRPDLAPSGNAIDGLAGYIWAGLGSPKAEERWECAHVVRNLVELGWDDLSTALAAQADIGTGGAFSDDRLLFYAWHARQWLAIGLARGGRENPAALAPFADWLRLQVESGHVVLRAFAAEALMAWADQALDHRVDRDRLATINQSPFVVEVYEGWQSTPEVDLEETRSASEAAEDRFSFGIDIGPYWLARLGRAFGVSQSSVEHRAVNAIRDRLGWAGGGWRDDARGTRRIFTDGETMHSHGGMPKTDDLTSYHAYHAMMLVAGDFLTERSLRRSDQEELNPFEDWLAGQMLTRRDGRWLFDRACPALVEHSIDGNEYSGEWPWLVQASDLDDQLRTTDGAIVLWGSWSCGRDSRRQYVDVRSALVSETVAPALCAALQTARDMMFERLPESSNDATEVPGGRLWGWVSEESVSENLDEFDPWGARVRYPGAEPDQVSALNLGLTCDADRRRWVNDAGAVVYSDSWTTIDGYGREAETNSHTRLATNQRFVQDLLSQNQGATLILRVAIRRNPASHEVRNKGFEPYPSPYVRFYLMRTDGIPAPF